MGADVSARRRAPGPGPVAPPLDAGDVVVRVLPDAGALGKHFDYTIPAAAAVVGSLVRIDLAGRRIGGWITAAGVDPLEGIALRPVAHVRGMGPDAATVDLAAWAAWRWAGRQASILATASPLTAVRALPPPASTPPTAPDLAIGDPVPGVVTVLTRGPAVDLTPLVARVAQRGPTIVVVPSLRRAAVLAGRLRRAGAGVALLPDDWAQARAGAALVIGARSAVWAPCPGLAAIVVIDGHDDALTQEQAPTWSAVEVAAERARRAAVPCVVTSPCPTATMLALATRSGGTVRAQGAGDQAGWGVIEVVDMREVDPRTGLWSDRVVALARQGAGTVVVVLNRTGRARLVTCAACASVARCERCGAAVGTVAGEGGEVLGCPRCGLERPVVCASCGSTALRRLRLGVTKAREHLEVLAGRRVGEVTAVTSVVPGTPVLIGTEAVLHRVAAAGAVAFVDFDSHLLAPRYRAAEEALALLVRASRSVGGRRRPGTRIVVQTRIPDHPVLLAAGRGDPSGVAEAEAEAREALRLPPDAAVAVLSGPGAPGYAAALGGGASVEVVEADRGHWVVRAPTTAALCDALDAVPRPTARLRVEVDPLAL